MDVAGALGWTAIFPFLIGAAVSLASIITLEDYADKSGPRPAQLRTRARFTLWLGVILVFIAVVMWITAIWMGYAQAALVAI